MNKQTPLNELVGGFARSARSKVTSNFTWHREGYWINKGFVRAPGKYCGDCVTELTEVGKSRSASSHLKCEDCGKTIGKREVTES